MNMDLLYGCLAAFGGGVLGAALGALPMFIMMGFIGFIGVAMQLSGSDTTGIFVNDIVLGVLTSPHIAFAGGVAAAAFAAHRLELLEVGSDIITPLFKINRASCIFVGGLFGLMGFLCANGLTALGYPGNPVATTAVLCGILARILWGHKGLMTQSRVKQKELEELKKADKGHIKLLDTKSLGMNLIIAVGIGFVFSYVGIATGVAEFGFYFSAVSLVLLQFGYSVPLTHHITLTCTIAAITTGNIWIGTLFAIIAWIVGDLWQNMVNAKDDTWLDTPSGSIAICALMMLVL